MLAINEKMSTKVITKISILSVLAFLIMLIEAPLWFTPVFLKIDASDLPALIGAFALGPMAGVMIEFLKNLLHIVLKGTDTAAVGELANFIVGGLFVYTAGYIYYKNKNVKSAVIGMAVGTVVMTIGMAIANYFVLIPFYVKLYGMPLESIIDMAKAVNNYVVDLKSFILYTVVPFNLIKGIIVSLVTLVIYKRISPILHR
ncbi:ECF transporter S component [Sporosalibacterium faouarense]|uniref:ECF transporter S component n=1 Tax=Sporosalibacterium faouarense TaxID=516123 RepID=UPI00192AD784|nr:ECF transporter S component [Sporosalibacterium faouarense]